MPVGPQLPPHLQKRKRSIDDTEGPTSPPRKVQAASEPRILGPAAPPPVQNQDEIDVNDSSEDDYGPSIPSAKPKTMASGPVQPARTVGPSLPPSKSFGSVQPARTAGPSLPSTNNPDELPVDDSSEDDYGPSVGPSKPPAKTVTAPPKRVLGPSAPPANISQMPSHPANPHPHSDSSDSEDDYGPSLPPPPGSHAETQMLQQRAQEEARSTEAQSKAAPKRDDWMVVPPSDSDWGSRVDPTKLKNRKFQSGKGSKAPIDKSGGISAIWTETPEQKRQRLEDEVLGRKDKALNSNGGGGGQGKMDKGEVETARRIQEYNSKNRNKSLFEEHQGTTGVKEKEDDPSKRGFDREKDMALGGRLGHGEKREMLAKAKDFGSRFQKGKYL